MMGSGTNLVMTVIGFGMSTMFIVFVCTRLICARIHLNAYRRAIDRASRSELSSLERGLHGLEPLVVANFPTKKYRELRLPSEENVQCTVCLSEYNDDDFLRILPFCGHSFHPTCIDMWLQRHSTCPVCRISLIELPERKWYMQPMFSSAVRSQSVNAHYCHCDFEGQRCSTGPHNHRGGQCRSNGETTDSVENSVAVETDQTAKDSAVAKIESPSS